MLATQSDLYRRCQSLTDRPWLYISDMRTASERLKWARQKAGYASAAGAARAIGVSVPSYNHHENGTRGFKQDRAARYAKFFKVDLSWLLTGQGQPNRRFSVPVLGYVGAGAEVISHDDHGSGELDRVELPMAKAEVAALVVRGDSMWPAYADNDLIFYDREPLSPRECIGRESVIRLSDGRTFVKVLTKGSQPGRFTLISYNAPPLVDLEVDWAVPVRWVERR